MKPLCLNKWATPVFPYSSLPKAVLCRFQRVVLLVCIFLLIFSQAPLDVEPLKLLHDFWTNGDKTPEWNSDITLSSTLEVFRIH